MNRHRTYALGAAAVMAAVSSTATLAQSQSRGLTLEEVVVTAQKRTENIQDVPLAVTVVNEAQLARQHIYSIEDLARTAPALEMIQAFGGPGGGGQVRGISTQSLGNATAEAAVGIVVDGVSQGRVNSSNIFDMERIEVLRGPQGTLFGLTTSAGVINMTTVAPKFGVFETRLHADFSDTDTLGSESGRTTLRGAVNVPINDSQALRFSVSGDRTEDVQYNEFKDEGTERNDFGARMRYRFKPSDDFELNLIADYNKNYTNYFDPMFNYVYADASLTNLLAACGITPGYDNNERCGNHDEKDTNKNYGASAQFDIAVGDSTLTSISGYRKNEHGPAASDIMGLASDMTQIFAIGEVSEGRQFTQELRITSPDEQRFEYVAGLFYSDYLSERGDGNLDPTQGFFVQLRTPAGFINLAPPSSSISESTNKSYAAFGQSTFHITDALGLITGLRYTHQKITNESTGNLFLPVPIPTYGEVTEKNWSWKAGLQYEINDDLTTYATYTRGYKGPQVSPAAQGVPATLLAAEIPISYEVGVKGALFNGGLGVDANVFYTEVNNFQGQRCRITSTGVLACPGETVPSITSKGVELSMYGSPFDGLTLNSGLIYNLAEYPSGWTGYNPNNLNGGTTSLSNEQLVNVPEKKFTFSGEYSVPMGSVQGFLSYDTVYKSDIRFGPTADPRFIYPAHWIHGARLGVRSESGAWSVALFGRNLTAEREPITLFGGPSFVPPNVVPFAPNGFVHGVSQIYAGSQLRQVGLTLEVNF